MFRSLNPMSSNQQLQDKISNWFLDEGLAVSKRDDELSDFHLVVPNAYNLGFSIDVIKPKNKPFVVIGMATQFPIDIKQQLGSLKPDERAKFLLGIQKELLKFGVEHAIKPTKENPNIIEVTDLVYVEEITRASFMPTLRRVKLASLFFIWSMIQKFSPESDSSKSPTAYG